MGSVVTAFLCSTWLTKPWPLGAKAPRSLSSDAKKELSVVVPWSTYSISYTYIYTSYVLLLVLLYHMLVHVES